MLTNTDLPATTILIIDGNQTDREYYARRLRMFSPDYLIIEAKDGATGLDVYRSRRIDCVLLELDLPDQSGFQVLIDLVPLARKPEAAVIVLTSLSQSSLHELAKRNGALGCFIKRYTTEEILDYAIRKAIAFVGPSLKEQRQFRFAR